MVLTTFALRRWNNVDVRYEYLFLPAETINITIDNQIISPIIPGGSGSDMMGGTNSDISRTVATPNFQMNLGSFQIRIQVSGKTLQMTTTDVPDITMDIPNQGTVVFVESGTTSHGTVAGFTKRYNLIKYVADQGLTVPGPPVVSKYTYHEMCVPDWGNTDLTIDGQAYGIFEGFVTNVNTTQVAGEPDIAEYSLTFVVGDG